MSVPHRKFLFVVFHDDECIGKHVVWYAEDLTARGHTVRIILEGQGTRLLIHPSVGPDIQRLTSKGLIAGVCKVIVLSQSISYCLYQDWLCGHGLHWLLRRREG